ncbi:hypothetical protein CIHG_06064 [Coccidioides immitis H538.4]|uniref:Uncharacterized protein n=1 Tax=Coccidioides immitis H538.4 TaxID=396776 RepID=A0A0J8RSX8_COCIT|nr:hypothetical protein CIHG_06064 [Coccidioides immitis H538.4]
MPATSLFGSLAAAIFTGDSWKLAVPRGALHDLEFLAVHRFVERGGRAVSGYIPAQAHRHRCIRGDGHAKVSAVCEVDDIVASGCGRRVGTDPSGRPA